MQINTKIQNGIRILLDLAVHGNGAAVSLRDLSARQGASEKYLWQVVAPLKSSGLVKASRGAGGGYRLARDPKTITLRQALDSLADGWYSATAPGRPGIDRDAAAVMQETWRALSEGWALVAEAVTLGDLAEKHRRRRRTPALNYEI